MAAQNTWRLTFSESNGGTYIQLTEVAFLDSGGNDLSVGGVALASSFYGGGYEAAKAFDKSNGTDWCSAAAVTPPHWLQYTHATPVEAAQVRITCSASSAWLPPNISTISLRAGASQEDRYDLSVASGSFSPSAVVVLNATPYVPPKGSLHPSAIVLSGGASSPAGPVLSPTAVQIDRQDGGLYRIVGDTKKRGTLAPLRRRVQLYNQRDNRLIRETWSDAATGDYVFDNIKGGPGVLYFVCAFDHTNTDKAVIADQLVPEPMP
ncbi:MAG: discoidin domain-containing protein [Giesbergeria sp.]|uniref:discoidin domain-containing protein n=1 Tax=Giesbergeria sp. TaxID=2818473 RepID=UPI0026060479|nr:discoidin domain-containing protein [Giesbergeria sp.]MDD2610645.1 discoidin domain-containing protein [Giesbergeria sp.]